MWIASFFAEAKNFLEYNLHLSRDALHVHIGVMLFFAMVFVLQRHPRRFVLALLGLFGLCLVNEAMDAYNSWRAGHPHRWLGSIKDIVNTLFWPMVVVYGGPLIARLFGFSITRAGGGMPLQRLTAVSPAIAPAGSVPGPADEAGPRGDEALAGRQARIP